MVISAYYDGSGKGDAPAVSLAGIAAPGSAWPQFDAEWEAALRKHGARCFHMTDALALQNEFAPKNGWSERKAMRLIGDLVKVMADHRNRGGQLRVCTVVRADYNRAKQEHPTLRPLPALCVNYCVGGLAVPAGHEVILYFDRNEPFMHQVNRVWLKLRKHRHPGWARQTRNIIPVDSGSYAIQAADFVAWSLNRQFTHGDHNELAICAGMLTRGCMELYNYDAIVERYANDKWS